MEKILIELILTNLCNKKCEYCDLNFQSKSFSFNDLDLFIIFLKNNTAEYTINFFWWEPLLEFEKMKYFIDRSKEYIYKYSLGTNWLLLNKKKLEYFKKNNIFIYLSIDNISMWNDLNLWLISRYSEIININFINDPDYLHNSIIVYKKIISFWFKNISFMPVFNTKKWHKKKLFKLYDIYKYIKKNILWIKLKTFSYFNWVSIEKQFILDTNLYFYSDLDSLLWLQKQYKNLESNLLDEITISTRLLSLKDKNLNLILLLNWYNIKKILKLIFKIPKKMWLIIEYKIIENILK